MSALLLYLATSIAIVLIWRRYVQHVSGMAAVVLVLLPLCFTGRALLTGRVYAPADLPYMSEPLGDYKDDYGIEAVHNGNLSDLYCQIIPWRKAVRWSIANGEWPLWNPFMLCGDILAQAAQPAPYDPVNLLGLLIPMAPSLTYGAAMTFFLAGFFTFAFVRLLGLSEIASIVAAAGFMFSAMLAFFVGWPLSRAWSFMPLVLAGVRIVVHHRKIGVLTAAFVLLIFAGHPESILHITFAGAMWGLFELITVAAESRRAAVIGGATRAVAAGLLALGLTAVFLLPFLDAVPQTVEHHVRTVTYANADFVTVPEVIIKRAGATFFPWFGGGPEHDNFTALWEPQSARVGSIVLALALVALVAAPKRKETWFFLLFGLFCLCAGLDAPPVAHLLHELPLFKIALNERLALAAAFSFAVLAGIATESLLVRPRRSAIVLVATAVAFGVMTWLLWDWQRAVGVRAQLIRKQVWLEVLPLLVIAALAWRGKRWAPGVILALLLSQRTVEDGGLYPSLPLDVFYPPVPVLEAIPRDEPEPFRIAATHFAFIPDTAAMYELEDVRGYEAMTFARLAQTYPLWAIPQPVSFNAVGDLREPFLSLANVRFALAPNDPNPPEGWRHIVTDRHTTLLENTRVLPRAFVPRRVRYEGTDAKVLEGMKEAKDYSDLAWILAPEVGPHEIGNGPGKLRTKQTGARFDINADMENDGWVVISNSAWKGWRAYLNGKRVNVHVANHAFLGVYVPQGHHHLRLIYLPASFTRGRLISFATAGALLAWVMWLRWKTRRATRRTPATST